MHHERKEVFAFNSDSILAVMRAIYPKFTNCHLRVWQHIVQRCQQPPLPQGQQEMGQQGGSVWDTQGRCGEQVQRCGETCIWDHWGISWGLEGHMEGVRDMHGTQGHP